MGRGKQPSPVDRSVRDLERQLAEVQRRIRRLDAEPVPRPAVPWPPLVAEKVGRFMKDLIQPAAAPARQRPDRVMDAADQSLQDLGAEPIAFGIKHEPDLFTNVAAPPDKLVHYLSAGSIKTYRPPKHGQREMRNRFWMWVGLSCLALWLLYVVVR